MTVEMETRGSPFPGTLGPLSQEATEGCASLIPNRKLKVTLLSNGWVSTFYRELAIQFAKNYNVEVTMYLPLCSEEDERAAAGFCVRLLKAKKKPGYDPIDWLASIPRDHRMDVVIGHGIHLGRQVPIIKEYHPDCKWIQIVDTDPEELGMFQDDAEVELCKLADQVVTVGPKLTEAFACYLCSCGKDQDVINLTPGISSEFANINQAVKERKTFTVLIFGRGDSGDFCFKGLDIAARAFAQLKDEVRSSMKLVFVGAPNREEEKVKERFLKVGISPSQLIVRSAKEREQLAEEFCQADLAIMPSRTEGFGLAALEALSAGLPVLVTDNSGIGKALKKVPCGSNCVVNDDPVKWTEAIEAVHQKERKVRLEEAILLRQKYAETYPWEGQCSTLVEKMGEMIKETSVVADQAVAAVNLGEQGPSSISEAVVHPDQTTVVQQHIVGDLVSSGRENEIKRKGPSHPSVTSSTERRQRQNAGILERVDYATFDRGYSSLRSCRLESSIGGHAMIQQGGVDHGTSDEGPSLLASNCLSSAMDLQSRIKESRGKRLLVPLPKVTPERERGKRDIPESSDESVSFKPGSVSEDDVILIAHELGPLWKKIGRVLKVPKAVINQIEADKSEVSDKCYTVLTEWQERFPYDATYRRLALALKHQTVGRVDLAAKYCEL